MLAVLMGRKLPQVPFGTPNFVIYVAVIIEDCTAQNYKHVKLVPYKAGLSSAGSRAHDNVLRG
jgi:hypothetical protein